MVLPITHSALLAEAIKIQQKFPPSQDRTINILTQSILAIGKIKSWIASNPSKQITPTNLSTEPALITKYHEISKDFTKDRVSKEQITPASICRIALTMNSLLAHKFLDTSHQNAPVLNAAILTSEMVFATILSSDVLECTVCEKAPSIIKKQENVVETIKKIPFESIWESYDKNTKNKDEIRALIDTLNTLNNNKNEIRTLIDSLDTLSPDELSKLSLYFIDYGIRNFDPSDAMHWIAATLLFIHKTDPASKYGKTEYQNFLRSLTQLIISNNASSITRATLMAVIAASSALAYTKKEISFHPLLSITTITAETALLIFSEKIPNFKTEAKELVSNCIASTAGVMLGDTPLAELLDVVGAAGATAPARIVVGAAGAAGAAAPARIVVGAAGAAGAAAPARMVGTAGAAEAAAAPARIAPNQTGTANTISTNSQGDNPKRKIIVEEEEVEETILVDPHTPEDPDDADIPPHIARHLGDIDSEEKSLDGAHQDKRKKE